MANKAISWRGVVAANAENEKYNARNSK